MKPRFSITVHGRPRPQGSHVARGTRPGKKGQRVPMLVESCRYLDGWRSLIRAKIAEMTAPNWPQHAPVRSELLFTFVRPIGHTGKLGNLVGAGLVMPVATSRKLGDIEKLIRAVHDSLDGVIHDDSQIVACEARKAWGAREGVRIRLYDACPECGRAVDARRYHVCDPD